MKNIFIIFLLLSASSCSFFKKKAQPEKDAIAHVNDEYLYASEISTLTKGLKGEDSIAVLKNYAESWVRRKLLLQKAQDNIAEDDATITRKVEDYREALILYEYEKALINKRLDTAISAQELDTWYEKLKDDFLLETDVYLIFFIKLKKNAPELDKARKWILKPKDEEERRKLEGYCREFATSYIIEEGVWYDGESIQKSFGISEGDINALTGSKNFREFKSDGESYFVKIADIAKKGQPSPVQFVRDKVTRTIIEKRRMELLNKIYDKLYQDGVKAKSFDILVK